MNKVLIFQDILCILVKLKSNSIAYICKLLHTFKTITALSNSDILTAV